MKFGSLFAGIGGIDLGLERAGMECAWQVEIDDYATKVLTKHWPAVPKFRDIRECGKHNLSYVDLVAGGFPCQDVSWAGPGGGLDGERSGLWTQYHRIIRELRPRFVLVENVSALLGRGIDRVLGDLAACGYDAEWDCIPAAAVGAPHRRDRLFIVAYSNCERQRQQTNETHTCGNRRTAWLGTEECSNGCSQQNATPIVAHSDGERQQQQERIIEEQRGRAGDGGKVMADPASFRERKPSNQNYTIADVWQTRDEFMCSSQCARDVSNSDGERTQISSSWKQPKLNFAWGPGSARRLIDFREDTGRRQWAVEPNVGRVANGVPRRVDRLRGLGNAVVPQIIEFIGRRIMLFQ